MTTRRSAILATLPLALLITGTLAPRDLHARISGEADLGYVRYDAEANGKKVAEASSFRHRYSLMYSTEGALYGGRIGYYNAALGYEWAAFDTKIKNPSDPASREVNPSISRGHLLYQGEVVIDPLELPLKLRAYSYDMNRISLQDDTVSAAPSGIIRPRVTTDLVNGTHINTGATAVFGVKNGLTNGYNAIFRHIPLVMLDYRDELHKDLKSASPMDTRLQRLAFVSLNKRDNWFHYRTTNFIDNLNQSQSYTESQVQIGTIDQALSRRWIDMTNWLKISTDGQFTKHSSNTPANSFNAYEVNLFGVATRQVWDARTFSTFSRILDQQGLSMERTIPLYATGVWGADVDWKGSLYNREKRLRLAGGGEQLTSNASGSLRADMFRRSPFTLGSSLRVEHSDTDGAKLLSFEGGVETASTRRFSRDYTISGSYTVKQFTSSNGARVDSTYLNQNAMARVAYSPSTAIRLEAEENISAASGSNPQNFSNSAIQVNSGFNGFAGGSSVNASFQRRDSTINEYVRYVTTAGAHWSPVPRVSVSFTVSEDILTRPDIPTDYLTTVRNTIDYSVASFSLRLRNSYNIRKTDGDSLSFIESQGTVEYKPNRNLDASLNYTYSVGDIGPNATSEFIDLRQRTGYTFYTFRGMNRKLLELTEEITYNRTRNAGELSDSVATTRRFTLGARYYPLSRLFLGGDAQYSLLDPGSTREQLYNATVGLTFQKLQASLDYSYGKRSGTDNRVEKRIAANVKKIF